MGRRTKLTPEVHNLIVEAIRVGNYVETSAQAAGISKQTLYRWLDQAEDDNADQIYRDFRDALESARAEAEKMDLEIITRAAHDGSWQAAAWKLERRTPQRWGRVNRTEVTGADGGALKVEIDHKAALLDLLGLSDADSDDG
jgi:transposase-like protein